MGCVKSYSAMSASQNFGVGFECYTLKCEPTSRARGFFPRSLCRRESKRKTCSSRQTFRNAIFDFETTPFRKTVLRAKQYGRHSETDHGLGLVRGRYACTRAPFSPLTAYAFFSLRFSRGNDATNPVPRNRTNTRAQKNTDWHVKIGFSNACRGTSVITTGSTNNATDRTRGKRVNNPKNRFFPLRVGCRRYRFGTKRKRRVAESPA